MKFLTKAIILVAAAAVSAAQGAAGQTASDAGGQTAVNKAEYDKWKPALQASYGFLPGTKTDGANGSGYSLAFTAGANYNITKSFYAGARIGYLNFNSDISVSVEGYRQDYNTISHAIIIPIEAGYRLFLVGDDISIVPYAGIDLDFLVSCKQETGTGTNKETTKITPDDKFGAAARIGARLGLWGFNVGFAYVFNLNKTLGDSKGYPEIQLCFGF